MPVRVWHRGRVPCRGVREGGPPALSESLTRIAVPARRSAGSRSLGPLWLELRREAFERAGLEPPPPAVAIFDVAPRLVIFVSKILFAYGV
jgi:hypothetical protein